MPLTSLVLAARRDEPNTVLLLLQRTTQGASPEAALPALPHMLRMQRLAPRLFDACLRLGLPRDAQRQWLVPNAAAGSAGWTLTVPQVLVYEAGPPATNRHVLVFLAVWPALCALHVPCRLDALIRIGPQAAVTDPVLLEAFLSHVLPKPPSDPALSLSLLNFALAHNHAALLDALLTRGLRADGRDMVDVPILHAAVRGGCTASVIATLLKVRYVFSSSWSF